MELTVVQNGSRTCFEISGTIDESSAAALRSRFDQLNLPAVQELVIDLRRVERIGSSGIGKFLLFYKNLAVHGGKIRIQNAPAQIYSLFQELKLDTIFCVSKDC